MIITDFNSSHIEDALKLAKANYEEERLSVAILPVVDTFPGLAPFADNGLGVAAFENGKMVGFLCCVGPFDNSFGSTCARGVFAPMGASGAVKENKAKIYAYMYQRTAEKWVDAGAVSHAICLYAHDETAVQQFFHYGFGLRCIDAIRPMVEIDCRPCNDYIFTEIEQNEFKAVFPLDLMLNGHMKESPTFMFRRTEDEAGFVEDTIKGKARYFVAKTSPCHGEKTCAFLKITDDAETFITGDSSMVNITGAFCLPEHRGGGVYLNLLNYAITTLKKEGYTRLGVDFESINPTAYWFWLKHFTAYTNSVVRRIDERILQR